MGGRITVLLFAGFRQLRLSCSNYVLLPERRKSGQAGQGNGSLSFPAGIDRGRTGLLWRGFSKTIRPPEEDRKEWKARAARVLPICSQTKRFSVPRADRQTGSRISVRGRRPPCKSLPRSQTAIALPALHAVWPD